MAIVRGSGEAINRCFGSAARVQNERQGENHERAPKRKRCKRRGTKDSLDMPERQRDGREVFSARDGGAEVVEVEWRWRFVVECSSLSLSLSTGNSSRREDTGYEGQANRRIDDRRPHGLAPGCRAKPHLNHPPWPLLRGGESRLRRPTSATTEPDEAQLGEPQERRPVFASRTSPEGRVRYL